MFRNYIVTALRNLKRQKTTAFINIAGLTLGITSSLVLFLLIKHHLNYDTYHTKQDRIYRVVTASDGNNGVKDYTSGVPAVLPDAFKNDFDDAQEVTFTSFRAGSIILIPQKNAEAKKIKQDGVTFAETSFFRIFDRKILIGDPTHGLDEPNEAIISKKTAQSYFGKEDALGEVITFENKDYKITAVMEDFPANTDFPFEVMLSYITIKKEKEENGWGSIWSDEHCYFLVKEGTTLSAIESGIPSFVNKYLSKDNWNHQTFLIQPLKKVHFDDRFGNYNYNTISSQSLIALGMIAIFLIITACINFINLATAEAIKRSKEVGIRKSLGSTRGQLVRQFLGETTFVTVLSVAIALGITQLALSYLNPFLKLDLSLDFSSDRLLWVFLIGVTFSVSLLSGLYPSFVISAYKPALALKNLISSKSSSGYALRRSLVVLQFFISQFFIIGTIVLISQMNYFQNKELGFKKDAIITIPIPESEIPATDGTSKMRTLRNEILGIAGVEMASLCSTPPSSGSVSGTSFSIEGKEDNYETQVKVVDSNYIDLFGLTLQAGKGLEDYDTARGFVVNEHLAKMVGFNKPQDIVGKEIKMWGKRLPVTGVVKDFHTVSLHNPIEATIMLNRIRNYRSLSFRINPSAMQVTLDAVRLRWDAFYPNAIFEYEFLDQNIQEFYEQEKKMSILLSIFTSLAIFIGCLGLFGLATFMAIQKTKEIGVRKVLGASVKSIVLLFSKEFVKLIVIGFVIAAPVAWYVMNLWLNEYAYKIELGPVVFLTGLGITFFIAILTVGYRSFRAATVNPVDSLKCE